MVLETDVVNKQSVLDFLEQQNSNVGFSVSCRSIIKSPIINFFKGRIYNIHPTLLPEEKGGGTFSWRILNNDDQISATLHLIDEGIDTGNILMQKKEKLRKVYPRPSDYMTRTNVLYKELIDSFLDQLPLILDLKGQTQSNLEGSYLPRLFTELHGAIDWSLDGSFIEKTIRAFSYPYPGAFTFYKEDKIQILESMFSEYSHEMHPLTHGKVISFDSNGYAKVIVRGGFLIVSKVLKKETENNLPSELFSHPVHFHTPNEYLERALSKSIKISETKKFE